MVFGKTENVVFHLSTKYDIIFGVPVGNRTRNLQRRRLLLYPIALQARIQNQAYTYAVANYCNTKTFPCQTGAKQKVQKLSERLRFCLKVSKLLTKYGLKDKINKKNVAQ